MSKGTVAGERQVTLIALFRLTAKLMVDDLVSRLRTAGYADCTAAMHPVLENIDPEGTRLVVLASRSGMTRQSMSELVARLEMQGYVERRADPFDGRASRVLLTRRGRSLARRATQEIAAIEREWVHRYRGTGSTADVRRLLEAGLEAVDDV